MVEENILPGIYSSEFFGRVVFSGMLDRGSDDGEMGMGMFRMTFGNGRRLTILMDSGVRGRRGLGEGSDYVFVRFYWLTGEGARTACEI